MMSQSTTDLVGLLDGIVHTSQCAIKPNAYEQAPARPIAPGSAKEGRNAFFLPFKDNRRSSHRKPPVESKSTHAGGSSQTPPRPPTAPKPPRPTPRPMPRVDEMRPPEMRDIVEILATVIEGHHVVEYVPYRTKLEALLLDPERLRAVTSKHRMLKTDVLEFLYEDSFSFPKNPLVGDVIAHALRSTVVMRHDEDFRVHPHPSCGTDGPAVLLSVRKVDRYDRLEDVRTELLRDGAAELRPFASMRVAELREYALGVLPDLDPKSTKPQIVCRLKKRFRV